jgi:predicted ATPase/DNA-binding SARP family transcriptional activator
MVDASLVLLDGVRWRDVPVPGERSHALLAALALEGSTAVGGDRLVHEVWGQDTVPAAPAKALQVLVSRTRAQTDPALLVRSGAGYRLGEVSVDFWALGRHTAAARRALDREDAARARDEARAALAVPVTGAGTRTGPGAAPRAGALATPGAPAGPVAELRRTAGELQDQAREVLGRALSLLGEHTEALPLLELAVTTRPDDEALLAALLRSEAAVRGAPAALERYERHRESVRDALGVDPGPGLQQLHAELLARDRPVREGLRHDATRLIGREDDVAALSAMIRTSRVTSIVGAGGLGKTRLAHVLGRLADQPVVHFVELAGVTTPEGVAVEVGSVLGVRESIAGRRLHELAQRHDLHARIVEQVAATPALLILDNCEHLVAAVADLVAILVSRAPRLRVLTTTRAPLGLAGERVYPLPQLDRADAVQLFRERATSARPGVRLVDARIGSLVDRLDGLPLAVELAAAKVRVMSVEEIERRLENRFALLRGGSRDAPERHQTLLAVIDWSWNLLDEEQRVALRRLSVFRDGFALAGAAAVIGVEDALGVVTALVDQSLVTVHEAETVRYRLLETVREFGRMQLVDAGDDTLAEDRLRDWAVDLARATRSRLYTRDQVAALAELRAEEGNLTDVLRRGLAERDPPTVVQVMAALAGLWTVQGDHLKVVALAAPVEDVLAEAPVPEELEDALRVTLSTTVVNTMILTDAPSARSLARLEELGPGTGEPRLRAEVRVLLTLSRAGGFGRLGALDALLDDPDRAVAMLAHVWTSQARENAGDLEGGLEAARIALTMCDDEGGPWLPALVTSMLANLSTQVGDFEAARAYAQQALEVMESLGAVEDSLQLRSVVAVLDISAGRLDQAAEMFAEIAADERNQWVIGGTLVMRCGVAELELARGHEDQGLRLYGEAVTALRELSYPGVEMPTGLAPWLLYPEAGALSAHARLGRRAQAQPLRDGLVGRCLELLSGDHASLDYPVTGAVLFALAHWELTGERTAAEWGQAVRLLMMAEGFAYNQMMPSLAWPFAASVAESRCPGLLASARAELAGRRGAELREEARALVAALSPSAG